MKSIHFDLQPNRRNDSSYSFNADPETFANVWEHSNKGEPQPLLHARKDEWRQPCILNLNCLDAADENTARRCRGLDWTEETDHL